MFDHLDGVLLLINFAVFAPGIPQIISLHKTFFQNAGLSK